MSEFDSIKYRNDYNSEKYDRYSLMLPKGKRDIIKQVAAAAGQSVNAYINQAIAERMERDKASKDETKE